jgi:ribose transport system permease protein
LVLVLAAACSAASASRAGGFDRAHAIGALIIGVLNNGMNMLDISSFYQQVVKGGVLLAAISLYAVTRNQDRRVRLSKAQWTVRH